MDSLTIFTASLDLDRKYSAADGDQQVYRFKASTRGPDHSNRIVEPLGWELANYQRNPVVTYGHEELLSPNALPIARAGAIATTTEALTVDLTFAPHARAQEIRQLVDEGYLNAMSAVWKAIEVERTTINQRPGLHFKRQTLLGLSIVAVPDNPHALRQAASFYATETPETDDTEIATLIREELQSWKQQS